MSDVSKSSDFRDDVETMLILSDVFKSPEFRDGVELMLTVNILSSVHFEERISYWEDNWPLVFLFTDTVLSHYTGRPVSYPGC